MSARKTRPIRGTEINSDMSQRDVAAALGISTGQLNRWKRLADVPEERFEAAISSGMRNADAIVRGEPAPAQGRVERAIGLFKNMTPAEQIAFLEWLGSWSARDAAA